MKQKMMTLILALGGLSLLGQAATVEGARIVRQQAVPTTLLQQTMRRPGTVELEVQLDQRGRVMGSTIRKGRPDLNWAALNAVRMWKFAPATIDGRRVASTMNVVLDFDFDSRN